MDFPPGHPAFDQTKRHPAFFSARMKLGRAGSMIEAFEQGVNQYISDNPSRLIVEPIGIDRCRVKLVTKQTPIEIPMMLGEILHNMRGALDHFASSIVYHAKQAPDRRINFPVHETKEQFIHLRTKEKPHQLAFVAPDIWKIIEESAQPWQHNDIGSLL